jgi:UDP-N-acetylglucosamine 4-epimerase
MTTAYETLCQGLSRERHVWLVTGAAGFIGSHITARLLRLGQEVVGLDNLSTGSERNLELVRASVEPAEWSAFRFVRGDAADYPTCEKACIAGGKPVEFVLHQAALGSVPRSVADPRTSNQSNVDGFLNMLLAAKNAGVKRFVYASSSSVYGDSPKLPKVEGDEGRVLSPYALTKAINEEYARLFSELYGFKAIGLRYFNVFGVRQDPAGPYAAVIARWLGLLLEGKPCTLYGDGATSRDFCHVDNAVQANLLAACATRAEALGQVYNIACGEQISLNELYEILACEVRALKGKEIPATPKRETERQGDVKHSLADITRAKELLGYAPQVSVREGLRRLVKESIPKE